MSLNGKPPPVIDGLTGDQRFFLAFAQAWRGKQRDGSDQDAGRIQSAQPAPVPRHRSAAQPRCLVHAFGVKPGFEILHSARPARPHLVSR